MCQRNTSEDHRRIGVELWSLMFGLWSVTCSVTSSFSLLLFGRPCCCCVCAENKGSLLHASFMLKRAARLRHWRRISTGSPAWFWACFSLCYTCWCLGVPHFIGLLPMVLVSTLIRSFSEALFLVTWLWYLGMWCCTLTVSVQYSISW